MHAWLKLACVVLAWTILPAGVITAGPGRSAHPVQAGTRTTYTSFTSASFTSAHPAAAAARGTRTSFVRPAVPPAWGTPASCARPAAPPAPARSYVVQPGDTLSAIA